VLITFGALLGKTSPLQLLGVALLEVVVYGLNFYIGAMQLSAVDMGGSLFVHTFGAYFGLAAAWALGRGQRAKLKDHVGNVSSKSSDTFAMIGTLFLWMFWPSFNGALAGATSQHRVIVNTVLSLCGSCVGAFIFSSMFRPGHKFSMVDIQNATLAGGVAVGGASDLVIQPWAALLTGLAASLVSVWGYTRLQGFLEEKVGLFDTCGVHNLHGMPGLIGGLSGTISAAMVGDNVYGQNIGEIYPARSTCSSATAEATCTANDHCAWSGTACTGDARTASEQASMQICALLITVAMAIGGGLFTAAIVKGDFFEPPPTKDCYSDHLYWDEVEAEDDDEETGGSVEMTAVVSGGTPSAGSTA
jgi:ammonium transporter Rh